MISAGDSIFACSKRQCFYFEKINNMLIGASRDVVPCRGCSVLGFLRIGRSGGFLYAGFNNADELLGGIACNTGTSSRVAWMLNRSSFAGLLL